jgi:hypothetical protein
LRGWLVWTPRLLLLLFLAFLALLSLDVVAEGRGAGEVALGLLVHSLPALALLAAALAAWRWPLVGALGLAAFAAWWLLTFAGRGFLPSVVLLMAVLPLTTAALFLTGSVLRGDADASGGGVEGCPRVGEVAFRRGPGPAGRSDHLQQDEVGPQRLGQSRGWPERRLAGGRAVQRREHAAPGGRAQGTPIRSRAPS